MVIVSVISFNQNYTITTCGICGVMFTVPEVVYNFRTKE